MSGFTRTEIKTRGVDKAKQANDEGNRDEVTPATGNAAAKENAPPPADDSDTPVLDEAAKPEGGALVANAAAENEGAADDESYTKRLLALKEKHPDKTPAELAEMMSNDTSQQSEAAKTGKFDPKAKGKKAGVYVGNWDYDLPWGDLDGAKRDALAMATKFGGEGFYGSLHQNSPSSSLLGHAYNTAKMLKAGDQLLYYYAGHGTPKGLVGVESKGPNDGIVPNAAVTGLVQYAEKQGIHMTAILDACHTGGATGDVRNRSADEAEKDEKAPESVKKLARIAKEIEAVRKRLSVKDTKGTYGDDSVPTTGAGRGLKLGGKPITLSDETVAKAHGDLDGARTRFREATDNATDLDELLPSKDDFVALPSPRRVDIAASMSERVLRKLRGIEDED